ncbi:MAG: hypothetical protein HQL95_04595 [Magnetococcales bacterium]|nr:hypothetical protein [Magnetococcales bacterium]
MTVSVELWQLITLLLAFFGFVAGGAKLLVAEFERRLDQKFSSMETSIQNLTDRDQQADSQLRDLERDLRRLQIDMPVNYVRREDYVRGQSVIEAKLDALYNKLENVMLKGVSRDY